MEKKKKKEKEKNIYENKSKQEKIEEEYILNE